MAEYPSLPLFTDAFLSDTLHLTAAQIGAYMMMLMSAWRSPDCTIPNDDTFLARICRMDKRTWLSNKSTLLAFWHETSDAKLFQKRLKDERKYVGDLSNKNAKAGRASALKRKNRHSTTVEPNANEIPAPTPTPIKEVSKDTSPPNPPIPDFVPMDVWDAFREMRRKIKKPMTAYAEKLAFIRLSKFRDKGHDPTEILNYSIMNNYPGIYEPKENSHGTNSTLSAGNSKPSWKSEGNRLVEKYRKDAEREEQAAVSGIAEPNLRIAETIRQDAG